MQDRANWIHPCLCFQSNNKIIVPVKYTKSLIVCAEKADGGNNDDICLSPPLPILFTLWFLKELLDKEVSLNVA